MKWCVNLLFGHGVANNVPMKIYTFVVDVMKLFLHYNCYFDNKYLKEDPEISRKK